MALEKARIINLENPNSTDISVMFNPPELKIKSSNNYADTKAPGDSKEKKQFVGRNNDVMTVVLFFDATRMDEATKNKMDPYGLGARAYVNPILELGKIEKDKKKPPQLAFAWGMEYFPCVILSIEQKYEYFDSSGIAQRAELTIQFQYHDPEEEKAPAAQTKPAAKKATVKAGEYAASFCADPKDWRGVCTQNNINNPFTFENGAMVGQIIMIFN